MELIFIFFWGNAYCLFELIAIGKYQSVEEAQTLIKYKN